MNTREYLLATFDGRGKPRPRVVCADGFSMSVQASPFHYSTTLHAPPRKFPEYDPPSAYSSVEVGFPSDVEDLLLPYAEDASNPTETVYSYVPVEVVDAVLFKHGGIAER